MPVVQTPVRSTKPLWGFGWVGLCLLPVAAVLGCVWWTGYDLRHQLLWGVNETLGSRAMMLLVGNWLSWQWTALTVPQFGPFAILYLLLAMHIHPRRFSWRW